MFASLTGRVLSSSGNVIGSATVTVLDGPDEGRTAGVDGNGNYRFDQLRVGNANFVAKATNYNEDRRGVFVNGTNTLNFSLSEMPPPAPPPAPLTITGQRFSGGAGYAEWRFTATGNIPPSTYRWDFGDDGVGGPFATDSHVYFAEGDYDVTVTATPIGGGTPVTATVRIIVRFG
jgi:PKD repeat protein